MPLLSNYSPDEVAAFKVMLQERLLKGPVTVEFTKKDGAKRVMLCTLSAELIPPPVVTETTDLRPASLTEILKDMPKKEKKKNLDVQSVYDLNAKAWRSFRWDLIDRVA